MKYTLILFVLLFAESTIAQKQVYKIEWKGDSIGYLVATKTISGELTKIELTSQSKFSIIFSFHMSTDYLSVFKNDKLQSALSRSTLNDKERSLTRTKYINEFYEIEVDGETSRLTKEISESIATLYFDPPENNEVFSERHGEFCRIEKVNDNHYRLIKPDNRINNYHYSKGQCREVQVELAMADIVFKRIL